MIRGGRATYSLLATSASTATLGLPWHTDHATFGLSALAIHLAAFSKVALKLSRAWQEVFDEECRWRLHNIWGQTLKHVKVESSTIEVSDTSRVKISHGHRVRRELGPFSRVRVLEGSDAGGVAALWCPYVERAPVRALNANACPPGAKDF